MKRICLLFALLISLFFKGFSQMDPVGNIIAFHPSVGNSVDLKEKQTFGIFKEYNDSLFESAQLLKYNDSTFTIAVKVKDRNSFEVPATKAQLNEIYHAIDRIQPAEDVDYVDKKTLEQEERAKRERRAEVWSNIGQATMQGVIVFLEVSLTLLTWNN
ncbi:MAG: hypothetical protein ACJ77K_02880 [Bacteroidia bacterium]